MAHTEYHLKTILDLLTDYCAKQAIDFSTVADMGTKETPHRISTTYCSETGHEFQIIYHIPSQSFSVAVL